MAAATGAAVLLETVEATAPPAAAPDRAGHSSQRGWESQPLSPGLLVDERERDRAARLKQGVAVGSRGAEHAATMDRAALRRPESEV